MRLRRSIKKPPYPFLHPLSDFSRLVLVGVRVRIALVCHEEPRCLWVSTGRALYLLRRNAAPPYEGTYNRPGHRWNHHACESELRPASRYQEQAAPQDLL